MLTRVLVIPAAGLGKRLHSPVPKVLTPVLGRPMLDYILDRHAPYCERCIVVVHPLFQDAVRAHVAHTARPADVVVQEQPSGMLDALVAAGEAVRQSGAERVWVTWCDQVAVSSATVASLDRHDRMHPPPALVLPTVRQTPPYIHFDRDSDGRITAVRQRREGDHMPEVGESDMGLFSFSAETFLNGLRAYGADAVLGQETGERNFLPFVPWMSARGRVVTFAVADAIEARGINTPDDLLALERHLKAHAH